MKKQALFVQKFSSCFHQEPVSFTICITSCEGVLCTEWKEPLNIWTWRFHVVSQLLVPLPLTLNVAIIRVSISRVYSRHHDIKTTTHFLPPKAYQSHTFLSTQHSHLPLHPTLTPHICSLDILLQQLLN